ncbi:MAG: carbohydrate ABC transporter permease, partial [Christensenellales bacterium]
MAEKVLKTVIKNKKRKKIYSPAVQIFTYAIVTLSVLFSFLSVYITVLNSLKGQYDIYLGIFALPTSGIVWSNFIEAFNLISRHLFNSVFTAFVGSFFTVFVGSVVAYIFSRKNFFGKEQLFMMYIAVLLMPAVTGLSVLYKFVIDLKLVDTYFAIWVPLISSGQVGVVFLFRTFFSQQPKSVFEAAKVDGANDTTIYAYFVLPMALPILMLNFVQMFTAQYNDFL